MAAPNVYSSTDTDAPVLLLANGSLIALLDAVLVNGYGTKISAGWSKAFSGTYKAAYTPAASAMNNILYRFDDSLPTNGGGYMRSTIQTYETMSSIDEGSGGSPLCYIPKAYYTEGSARPWIIIADSYGFHLWIDTRTAVSTEKTYHYFGQGIPIFSADPWFSLITGMMDNGSTTPSFGLLSSSYYTSVRLARKLSGLATTIGTQSSLNSGGGCCTGWSMGSYRLPSSLNYPLDGKLIYTQPFVGDGDLRSFRGFIPGLYCPEHASGLVHGQIYIDESKSLMALKLSVYPDYDGWALIDISAGFRP